MGGCQAGIHGVQRGPVCGAGVGALPGASQLLCALLGFHKRTKD